MPVAQDGAPFALHQHDARREKVHDCTQPVLGDGHPVRLVQELIQAVHMLTEQPREGEELGITDLAASTLVHDMETYVPLYRRVAVIPQAGIELQA